MCEFCNVFFLFNHVADDAKSAFVNHQNVPPLTLDQLGALVPLESSI
jgi:hypothetical protein